MILFIRITFFNFLMLFAIYLSSQSSKKYTIKGGEQITIYYKSDLQSIVGAQSDDINQLTKILESQGYEFYRWNEKQWLVMPSSYMKSTIEDAINFNNYLQNNSESPTSVIQTVLTVGERTTKFSGGNNLISGKVVERRTKTLLIGAVVEIPKLKLAVITDANGEFQLSLKQGEYDMKLSYLGFESQSPKLIVNDKGSITIEMSESTTQLDEVVVSEKANDNNVRNTIVGVQQLTMKQIQKLPTLLGQTDAIKSLSVLSGVNNTAEGVGGISVRGGSVDQNLFILNDVPYSNPNHALGFIAAFNPDFVNKVDLYKGYIPPQYGGRLSSVISLKSKEGVKTKRNHRISLGLLNSGFYTEGPIVANRLSYAIGGRVSHANWLIKLINLPDARNSKINFYDLNGKLDYSLSNKTMIGIEAYKSNDLFTLFGETQFLYTNLSQSAYLRHIIDRNTSFYIRVSNHNYKSDLLNLVASNQDTLTSGIGGLNAKFMMSKTLNSSLSFSGGVEINILKITNGYQTSKAEITEEQLTEKPLIYSPFVEGDWKIMKNFTAQLGLRYNGYINQLTNPWNIYTNNNRSLENIKSIANPETESGTVYYSNIEPRLSLSLILDRTTSVKGGYTANSQYYSQISNSLAAAPIDYWKVSDKYFKPLLSNSYTLGIFKNFAKDKYETSVEVFYSKIKNTIDFIDFAELYSNPHLETDVVFGNGKNYGVEVSLNKNIGKITGKLNYTFSRALYQSFPDEYNIVNNGNWYRSPVDKPHVIDFLMSINVSQRVNFNFNFNYSSGRPISAPINRYADLNATNILFFGERNGYRIPDFHRLDVSMNINPSYKINSKVKHSWNFSVANVYARKNPYVVFFRQRIFESVKTYRYSILGTILPSASLKLDF